MQRHAFAWIRHLDVVLGDGRLPLTVDAYAFYGARWMRQLVVRNVPALTLRPRIFTNTESVDRVEISNTRLTAMDQFVFEGLKDVGRIVLDRVDVAGVHSYAFSGIHFRPDGPATSGTDTPDLPQVGSERREERKMTRRRERYARSGGLVNVTGCHVGVLSADAFRDANLAQIVFSRTDVDRLDGHAFRGVTGLQSLRLVNCRVGPSLRADMFAGLRGVRQLHLEGLVGTRQVDGFVD